MRQHLTPEYGRNLPIFHCGSEIDSGESTEPPSQLTPQQQTKSLTHCHSQPRRTGLDFSPTEQKLSYDFTPCSSLQNGPHVRNVTQAREAGTQTPVPTCLEHLFLPDMPITTWITSFRSTLFKMLTFLELSLILPDSNRISKSTKYSNGVSKSTK